MNKELLITFVVLGLVVLGVGWYFFSNLDSIVAGVIETEGSKVTGTQVSVSGAEISAQEGRGTISGLTPSQVPRVLNPTWRSSSMESPSISTWAPCGARCSSLTRSASATPQSPPGSWAMLQ